MYCAWVLKVNCKLLGMCIRWGNRKVGRSERLKRRSGRRRERERGGRKGREKEEVTERES